jgi:hypothetical protein
VASLQGSIQHPSQPHACLLQLKRHDRVRLPLALISQRGDSILCSLVEPSEARKQTTETRKRGATLSLDTILAELKAERDRLGRATAALEGTAAAAPTSLTPVHTGRRGGRQVSAEARRRMSEAQKRRRAKEKRAAQRGS